MISQFDNILNTQEAPASRMAIEDMPSYAEIERNFITGFGSFERRKKMRAICEVMQTEFPGSLISESPVFAGQVADALAGDALMEKPYVFISVNRELLV